MKKLSREDLFEFGQKYGLREKLELKMHELSAQSKFVIMISDIIDNLDESDKSKENNIDDHREILLKIVDELAGLIALGDNTLDGDVKKFTPEQFLLSIYNMVTIPFKIQKMFNEIPKGNVLYNELVLNVFQEELECEKIMQKLKHTQSVDEKSLINFLEKRNSDFFLYTGLLSPFLRNDVRSKLKEFFQEYITIDIILDDLVDIFDDIDAESFNLVTYMLWSRCEGIKFTKQNVVQLAVSSKVLDELLDLASKKCDTAAAIISNETSSLFNYCRYMVEGSRRGIRMVRMYLESPVCLTDIAGYSALSKFLLKPYPWVVSSYDDIHEVLERIAFE